MKRRIRHSECHWGILLHSNTVQIEERKYNLPTCHEHNFPWSSTKNGGILYWWYCSKKSQQNQLPRWPENRVWHHVSSSAEDEPDHVILESVEWKFLGFIITSKGIHLYPDKVKAIQSMQPLRPKSSEVYKTESPISKDLLQIFQAVANRLHG